MHKQYGMLIDLRRCAGCHACTVACKSEHNVPLGSFRTRVESIETGHYPTVRRHFTPMMCNQCTNAPCITACPTKSIQRDNMGIITINQESCTGVADCVPACPYEAIFLHPQTNIASKCDFCKDRLNEGEEPACVSTCPTDAFVFGDINNSSSKIASMIKDNDVLRLQEEAATEPNVFYLQLDKMTESLLGGINNSKGKKG
ncbi:4Fe-4S dicluster domain-containing protein [Alkalihalobacillus deserti]|uniref:4Fe-4S dicluster domain-containing protein n=1 Tax=Alkalihalobacillus deserti TaxID=2879466 RepID=UPI001D1401C3|nr:4Fe-4S dicluster domain-containing protein [Alkalihalobacillus deserti]